MIPNLYTRVAEQKNHSKVISYVEKLGYTNLKTVDQLSLALADIVSKKGDAAILDIIKLHPDASLFYKAFILLQNKSKTPDPKLLPGQNAPVTTNLVSETMNADAVNKYKNCAGCISALGADGKTPEEAGIISEKTINKILIIGSGIVFVALATVLIVSLSNKKK